MHIYPPPYRNDIDGLRAIAVIPVVIFHAFPESLKGGFTGVDIFFVISGFIISTILFTGLDHNRFSLVDFYARRARRLFPALVVVFSFSLFLGWFVLFSDEYAELGKHVLSSSVFVQNFNLLLEAGYFDTASALKPLLHIWSLSIEEQFYAFWPILLVIMWRYRVSFVAVTLAVLFLSFALNIYLTNKAPSSAFYLPVSRFWELMIGGLGASIYRNKSDFVERTGNALPVIGVVILFVGFFRIKEGPTFPGWIALAPTIGALFVLLGNQGSFVSRSLSLSPLVWFGKISYPLYLWHWPLLAFARIAVKDGTFREPPVSWRLVAVLLSVVFAYLTYRYIEKPIRYGTVSNKLISFSKKTWAVLSAVALLGVAIGGGLVYVMGGLPSRFQLVPASAVTLFEPYPHKLENDYCRERFPELKGSWTCLLSKPEAPDLLLIGDSHAHQYYNSLARQFSSHVVMNYSQPGCFPFSRNAFSTCEKSLAKLFDFVENNPSIKTIVLTGYFSFLEGGFKFGNIEGQRVANDIPAPQDREAFKKAADMVLKKFDELNLKVIVLRDIPDLVFSPRSCVGYNNLLMGALRGMGDKRSIDECGISYGELNLRNKPYEDDLTNILSNHSNVIVLDPKPVLCHSGFCNAVKDQDFLYWNSDHLTITGSDLILGYFFEELNRVITH